MDGERNSDAGGEWAAPVPDAVAGLAAVRRGVALVQAAPTMTLTDAELRDVVADAVAARAALEAGYLHLLAALDARGQQAVPGASAGTAGATFLIHATNTAPAQASRDVRAARALDTDGSGIGQLPSVGAALAAGAISRAHVDVAVRCLNRIPRHLLAHVDDEGRSGITRIDAFLAEYARQVCPTDLDRLSAQLLAVLDPNGSDTFDPDAHHRRYLSYRTGPDGMLLGRFALDPAAGAVVKAAIEALVKEQLGRPDPGHTPDGHTPPDEATTQETLPIRDDRSPGQRRADALHQLGLDALRGGRPGSPTSLVTVIATPEHLDDATTADATTAEGTAERSPTAAAGRAEDSAGNPLAPPVLAQLLCGALLTAVLLDANGAVLNLGRTTRLATPAQRRALTARDRGCVVPGCTVPAERCEAHHVVWWRTGGRTDLDNLALLCGRHHTDVHCGHWRLTTIDGLPYAIGPPWTDPTRTPRRNTLHTATPAARRLARRLRNHQLRLHLSGDTPPDHPR